MSLSYFAFEPVTAAVVAKPYVGIVLNNLLENPHLGGYAAKKQIPIILN
jgi:hypothetical protein